VRTSPVRRYLRLGESTFIFAESTLAWAERFESWN